MATDIRPQETPRWRSASWSLLLGAIALSLGGCDGGGGSAAKAAAGGPTQDELAIAFNAGQPLFEAKSPAQLGQITAITQATTAPVENGLQITATGNDPALRLPAFAAGKRFVVQVVIDSPAEGGIQLFHKLVSDPTYAEARAPLYPLKKGKNAVYWRIDASDVADPLRLDPGYTAGTYVIESIEARSLPDQSSR